MKTEVYTWRVSSDLKTGLERAARRRKISMSTALDLAAREWLDKTGTEDDGEEEQRRLRKAAAPLLGALAGGNPRRSENTSHTVRQQLRRYYGR
jgi:hypothetical protein